MRKHLVLGIFQVLLIIGLLNFAYDVRSVKASGNVILIMPDGRVEPSGTPLNQTGNYTYTFTDSIFNTTIVVQRSVIVIDGNGFTLQASGGGIESGFNITTGGYGAPAAHNVTIKNLTIKGFYYGVYLNSTQNNVLSGNIVTYNNRGFWLEASSGNYITGNSITNNDAFGVMLSDSTNNNVTANAFLNNGDGVIAQGSPNNIISKNYMANNGVGVNLGSYSGSRIFNNTFVSDGLFVQNSAGCTVENNTINGRSLVYLEGVSDRIVEDNAGQVLMVNCNNVTIRHLVLSNAYCGVVLDSTSNAMVTGNNFTADVIGVWTNGCSNVSIVGNHFVTNDQGISFSGSHGGNVISGNSIVGSTSYGILIVGFSFSDVDPQRPSKIVGNIVLNNHYGIVMWFALYWSIIGNNVIESTNTALWISTDLFYPQRFKVYHNNFINNTAQTLIHYQPDISWDNSYPSGGNYWSDYTGGDANYDGIGDTPYAINGGTYTDKCPLIAPINIFNTDTWNNQTYEADVISDSNITNFSFIPENHTLSFAAEGEEGTTGFSRVAIPTGLMWCNNPAQWLITVDDALVTPVSISEQGNYTYICLLYFNSTGIVKITSTNAVPEFPQLIILTLLMATTLLAVIIYQKGTYWIKDDDPAKLDKRQLGFR